MDELADLLTQIRSCTQCAAHFAHPPRPIVQASAPAKLLIIGQAPGLRVQMSGRPFDDPSGVRLRAWLGLSPAQFYDPELVAIAPTGFCYPGRDSRGADLPPRPECAPLWRRKLLSHLRQIRLTVLLGGYAMREDSRANPAAKERAQAKQSPVWGYVQPDKIALPHPSWRNNALLKREPWIEAELLPLLRVQIQSILASEDPGAV